MIKTKEYELSAFITNLGKYNEGYLIGKYIRLPIAYEELKEALDDIGITEYYEEYFFTDFDGTYPRMVYDMLGEYTSIAELNRIALALEKVSDAGVQEAFEAFLENGEDFYSAAANAIEERFIFIKGDDYSDLAEFYIDACGGITEISKETLEYFFDYEMFGRDIRLEYYQMDDDMPETASEYWCGYDGATDSEIGQAFVDNCGFSGIAHIEYYFDYSSFGREISDSGEFVFTDSGIVDCSDFDDSLGETFKQELNEELDEKGDDAR